MYFSADPALGQVIDGGTDVIGSSPSLSSSFAEGTVRPGFLEYLTLQNASTETARAAISFQASDDQGARVGLSPTIVSIPAMSRSTFNVSQYVASSDVSGPLNVSAKVTSDVPLLVERPMYFSADPALGQVIDGGTDVIGSSPSLSSSFAEGTVR